MEVILKNGGKILLEDDREIFLTLISKGEVRDRFELPYPNAGYGGGGLKLSPSGKYLVLSYFSGESEEAFALFEVSEGLKFLYNSGYFYGEGAKYGFSADEKTLIQTFRTDNYYRENAKTDENGELYYNFGELNLFDIKDLKLERHSLRVYPAQDWIEEETDIGDFSFLKMDDEQITVALPWGEAAFQRPLKDILTVQG